MGNNDHRDGRNFGATRRDFMGLGLVGAALALGAPAAFLARHARAAEPAGKSLSILILGGSGFLGPAVIDAALARGHKVTIFNRGLSEKKKEELYEAHLPEGLERLVGNRDPEKLAVEADPTSPKGLTQLEGDRTWDACVDNSGYVPRIVGASAGLLKDRVKHYTFISSVSVYASNATPGSNEDAPLATIENEKDEEFRHPAKYGALKALCEKAAEREMPGRVASIRPGFIVGPWDPTDRFTYWPVRVSRGGEMAVPGSPDDPVQIIDVRDLAEFIITCIERNTTGVFNALGPANKALTMGKLLESCSRVTGGKPEITWLPLDFLEGKLTGMEFPIWIPSSGETAGFHQIDVSKPVAAGLKFRPIDDTVSALMAWWKTLPESRRNEVRAGIKPDAEAAMLKAFRERAGG